MKKKIKISHAELLDIISALQTDAKEYRSVGMKKESEILMRLRKRLMWVKKKCSLGLTLTY